VGQYNLNYGEKKMATVKLTGRIHSEIMFHLKEEDAKKAVAAHTHSLETFKDKVRAPLDLLSEAVYKAGHPMRHSWIEPAPFVAVSSVNNKALSMDLPQPDAYDFAAQREGRDARMLISSGVSSAPLHEFRNVNDRLGRMPNPANLPSYRGNPEEGRDVYYQFYSHNIKPAGGGISRSTSDGMLYDSRDSGIKNYVLDCDPPNSVTCLVPARLPVPSMPTRPGGFDVHDLKAMQQEVADVCEGVELLGAMACPELRPRFSDHDSKFYLGHMMYFVNVDMDVSIENTVRSTIVDAIQEFFPACTPTRDPFIKELDTLMGAYSSVNSLVRDIPTVFPLLPTDIQTKLRKEVKRPSRRVEVLSAEEKEIMRRKAMLIHLR
jgi:hypothetical protein